MLWFMQQRACALKSHRIIKVYDFSNIPTTNRLVFFCFLKSKGNEMKKSYILFLSFASLLVCSDGLAVSLCEDCTAPDGTCARIGPTCCAPCTSGGIVTQQCAAGYYGLYPNCSKCPAGPNGEPTTSTYGTATIIGCYIASGTDFEDNTWVGEYVGTCYYSL